MEHLDEGTLGGFRKVFMCFSRTVHGEDLVGAPEMLSVLRALGVSTATEGDAVDLISLVDTAGRAALDFEQFVTVMCSVDLRDGDAGAELQVGAAVRRARCVDLSVSARLPSRRRRPLHGQTQTTTGG